MKHVAATILAILLAACAAYARTAAEVFVQAPDSVMPLFSQSQRMDMVDYHAYGLSTPVRNKLNGLSFIPEASKGAVTVNVGNYSTLQVGLVPLHNDTLVAIVETVLTPQADSSVTFYRLSDWSIVRQRNTVKMSDFVHGDVSEDTLFPPMFFRSISYDPSEGLFVYRNTTEGYYTATSRPDGLALLVSEIKARFDGKRWRIVDR